MTLQRHTPLRSHSTLKRSPLSPGKGGALRRSWLRRKSPRRIARETDAERTHKMLIREARACCVAKYTGALRCSGALQVAHLGAARGVGLKHGDWTETSLMCSRHHADYDQRKGPFAAMSNEERNAFSDREIALAREFVAGRRTVSA